MKIILLLVSILMIIATLMPLIKKDNWWIRGFDFPRLQITFVISCTLFGYLIFIGDFSLSDQVLFISLILCLSYQLYMIYPYTFLSERQVQKSESCDSQLNFSLLCANVQMTNRNSSGFRDIIKETNPDIILAIETDDWWVDQLKYLETEYPYTVTQPQDNMYGMALYSRLELTKTSINFLVQDDIPSIDTTAKLGPETEISLHCLHPRPPFPTGSDQSTERDAELLIVGKEIKDVETPTVVLGDMNDVAWSQTNYLFQDISGLLDPRVGRGFYNTFHAQYPFIRFPLDHFFHSKHFRLIDFKRLGNFGSDHFPVYIELSLEADAPFSQEELEADYSEEKEAEKKIEKAT